MLAANGDKAVKIDQFYADAAAGTLPAFSLVGAQLRHGVGGERRATSPWVRRSRPGSINAVMSGPAWSKTLLVWCYDEHGGYYDHVPPPAAVPPDDVGPKLLAGDVPGAYDRYGFRVPAVVVSPWARADYVSSVVHDHTSVLALVERKFNLPALTNRDGAADDLLDTLDFSGSPPFATPPRLPAPHNTTGAPLCTAPGPVPNPQG